MNPSFSRNNERRGAPRLDRTIPLKICSADGDIVTETKNLSRSGAYCRVTRYIEPMTKLKIHLLLPIKKNGKITTRKVSCSGVIVRAEAVQNKPDFNIAIFFNDINSRDAASITEYIDSSVHQN